MTGDLFNAGFAWSDDVALSQPDATPVATAPRHPAPSFDRTDQDAHGAPVAGVAGVAETEGQRLERMLSQPAVARIATPIATAETADFRGVQSSPSGPVAGVATVADWEAGITSLDDRYAPRGILKTDWARLVRDSRHLMRLWGHDLHAAGWTAVEAFGVEPDMSHRRLDRCGLAFFINGGDVEAIDSATALICHGKDRLTFQRAGLNPGAVPIWAFSGKGLE